MTPKEKANKLVDVFRMFADGIDQEIDRFSPKICKENAKQCALISCDEILSLMIKFHNRHIEDNSNEIIFWEEVKEEINLL